MERQIFIPVHTISDLNFDTESDVDLSYDGMFIGSLIASDCYFNISKDSKLFSIIWLGLVNQFLSDKANAKEIINVIHRPQTVNEFDEVLVEGYLITYLESEMIASKEDLESAWDAGEEESGAHQQAGGWTIDNFRQNNFFYQWFEQNFTK